MKKREAILSCALCSYLTFKVTKKAVKKAMGFGLDKFLEGGYIQLIKPGENGEAVPQTIEEWLKITKHINDDELIKMQIKPTDVRNVPFLIKKLVSYFALKCFL